MKLEQEIKMEKFRSQFQKAYLNIIFTGNWMEAKTDALLKPFDISHQQYNVLRILRGQQGEAINLYEVQERMLNKMSNATRLVEKLRQKGLVTREQCASNRRKVEIAITPKGLDLLNRIDPLMQEQEEKYFGCVSEQEAELINRILDRIHE